MTEFVIRPIGRVLSPYKTRKDVPPLGGPAVIEVFEEFAAGLLKLEKHSHVWVLAWLDQAERDRLQVIPRGLPEVIPDNLHGVFAVRSPVRPNPISLTLAQIARIDGRRIELDRLDLADGTPVVDLKPYFVSRDAAYAARNEPIGQPANREVLRESLEDQAYRFHGERCPELRLAVELYTHFRADLLGLIEPQHVEVTLPIERSHMADAFIGMARVSLGRGTLRFGSSRQVRLVCERGEVQYRLNGGTFTLVSSTIGAV